MSKEGFAGKFGVERLSASGEQLRRSLGEFPRPEERGNGDADYSLLSFTRLFPRSSLCSSPVGHFSISVFAAQRRLQPFLEKQPSQLTRQDLFSIHPPLFCSVVNFASSFASFSIPSPAKLEHSQYPLARLTDAPRWPASQRS